uniref:Uncharacterized protein n=1 Tax=viral metagenome TaxID=1070528 RepID=A0A6C0JW77_9ZZZZ
MSSSTHYPTVLIHKSLTPQIYIEKGYLRIDCQYASVEVEDGKTKVLHCTSPVLRQIVGERIEESVSKETGNRADGYVLYCVEVDCSDLPESSYSYTIDTIHKLYPRDVTKLYLDAPAESKEVIDLVSDINSGRYSRLTEIVFTGTHTVETIAELEVRLDMSRFKRVTMEQASSLHLYFLLKKVEHLDYLEVGELGDPFAPADPLDGKRVGYLKCPYSAVTTLVTEGADIREIDVDYYPTPRDDVSARDFITECREIGEALKLVPRRRVDWDLSCVSLFPFGIVPEVVKVAALHEVPEGIDFQEVVGVGSDPFQTTSHIHSRVERDIHELYHYCWTEEVKGSTKETRVLGKIEASDYLREIRYRCYGSTQDPLKERQEYDLVFKFK